MAERVEWVEIIEPRTKEHMYANLITGECVWDPPPGCKVKRTNDNQWWELFDQNAGRFYYYNATSQRTVWHRPQNADIIPLAKLQTLKQNTEVREESSPDDGRPRKVTCEMSTQTSPDDLDAENSTVPLSYEARFASSPRYRRGTDSPSTRRHERSERQRRSERRKHSMQQQTSASSPETPRAERPRIKTNGTHQYRGSEASLAAKSAMSPRVSHKPKFPQTSKRQYLARQQAQAEREMREGHTSPYSTSDGSEHSTPSNSHSRQGSKSSLQNTSYTVDGRMVSRKASVTSQHGTSQSYPMETSEGSHSRQGSMRSRNRDDEPTYVNTEFLARIAAPTEPLTDYPRQKTTGQQVSQDTQSYSSSFQTDQYQFTTFGHSRQRGAAGDGQVVSSPRMGVSVVDREQQYTSHSRQGSVSSSHQRDLPSSPTMGHSHMQVSTSSFAPIRQSPGSPIYSHYSHVPGSPSLSRRHDRETPDSPILVRSHLSAPGSPSYSDPGDHFSARKDSFVASQQSLHSNASNSLRDGSFEYESDGVFSSPSPGSKMIHENTDPNSWHASLRRKKSDSSAMTALEKSQSLQSNISPPPPLMQSQSVDLSVKDAPNLFQHDPRSCTVPGMARRSSATAISPPGVFRSKPSSESDIENFAQEHLAIPKKGIFKKKVSVASMLSWSKEPIKQPLIVTEDKILKKEAVELFKLIQGYMGDRKCKGTQDEIALELTTKGWSTAVVRDEIYIQLCKQTTENKKAESLEKGWELMAICLTFFPPSPKFHSFLESYVTKNQDPIADVMAMTQVVSVLPVLQGVPVTKYAKICGKRLERIFKSGARHGTKKPSFEEINQSRNTIFNPSMFGTTLEEIMEMQKDRFPDYTLPWIQTVLSEEVLRLQGTETEGIFRVPGDIDSVNELKLMCDQWQLPECDDPHVPSSLLKLWYRELAEPLIPHKFYEDCVEHYEDVEKVLNVVNSLPEINRLVLCYLVRFLQVFSAPQNVTQTKMDASNLAMVMAPNCLRCPLDDPKVIFENTRKEMSFLRTLLQNLDTSFLEGVQ
ncbi:PREDICTED: LOW QUALITY PROTEIN: rho GTPase-activating protein 39-like [Branchiostoma belcheri]|uniref:Rho GTPase-activating protein 39 n=1 Tax=Branchiostoma belcheri TaxID=7741 RepID=A0A6P4ZMW5_BRABE|nr:PREDICTED: LOW QUALITY PROTEIN: rho GTPase-activating protein 39-like [Branchiostoma belcheri]